ncbi:SpoIIE family protein phosphatase [Parafrankia discariae]|uniref:SpoIIE family protein phosphatase n=1 Tax=Parafrankia discariae TaxID=365528 RepID=UPI0003A49CAE|nr:SpoIIE family protein phosphatase [Parafrankia discariae]
MGKPEVVREVFDSMSVMLVGLDGPEHRVVATNAAYRTSMNRDAFVGVPLVEVFPEIVGQRISEMCDWVYQTGLPQVARSWRLQLELEPESGHLTEIFVDFTMSPRLGPDGTVVGLNFHGVDSTERTLEDQRMRRDAAEAVQRYEQARGVITALQRQLLPAGLPVLPSVRIAASYLLADADDAAGGDWFDAVPVSGGRVALVVGDVVGHGVAASATMGQLRSVLQDRLEDTGDILAAVAAADRLARRIPGARAATVCVVLLDPADGTLICCSAGHPPPLIAGSDTARFLPESGQGPLGTGASYAVLRDRLEPDEVLLLYSDGIIERPGRTPAAATAELSQVLSDAVAGRGLDLDVAGLSLVDRACMQTLELLLRPTGHTDDITLLAAQRHNPAPPLRLGGPATTSMINIMRAALEAWVEIQEAGEADRVALTHAVVELVTNACEHGRPATAEGTVTVSAELRDDGEARVTVADNGRWCERARPGDAEYRRDHGFGLAMAASFTDHLDVERGDRGTTVTIHRRLSRSARLLTAERIGHDVTRAAQDEPELMLILDQPNAPSSRIAIHGPLDASNAGELGVELDRLTLGGTHELIVDLTAVTHLASAAVAELYRTDPRSERRHYPLRLYAPAGSTAHHVLSLVDLPHTTGDPHHAQAGLGDD